MRIPSRVTPYSFLECYIIRIFYRLQAVPFWIVERSREIAEREKKTRANEGKGAWGEAEKGERKRKGLRS